MIYSHTNIRLSHCIKLVCEDIECDGSVSVGLMRERVGDRDPSTENGFMTCTVHLSWIVSGISEFLFNDDYWIGFPESISIKSVAFALLFVSNADRKISRTSIIVCVFWYDIVRYTQCCSQIKRNMGMFCLFAYSCFLRAASKVIIHAYGSLLCV